MVLGLGNASSQTKSAAQLTVWLTGVYADIFFASALEPGHREVYPFLDEDIGSSDINANSVNLRV